MSSAILVKICGITRFEDARFALQAGTDWIGLNLVAGPRKIELQAATAILARLDDPSRAVVLVEVQTDAVPPTVLSILHGCGVRRLQLYGEVTPQVIRRLADDGHESILVHPVADENSLDALDAFLVACDADRPDYVLFDAAVQGQAGGTGRLADWKAIAQARCGDGPVRRPRIILAGGLTASNVAEAVHTVAPFGVDVSSGVESSPGCKDHGKMTAFVAAARQAAARRSSTR